MWGTLLQWFLTRNRIRKIKCDEQKPACKRCTGTGRTCDGYKSPFRFCASQPTTGVGGGGIASDPVSKPAQGPLTEFTPQEIDHLNRCFSTKTIFNVKLDCDEEARQVLQASLIDPSIQHAVSSLRALRQDLEISGFNSASVTQQNPSYNYGIQQYSMALRGLASNMSSPGFNVLKSALLCCQLFISIEQVQKNYAAMTQHIIRGLRIMHEYRARPAITAANELLPAQNDQLPMLDLFIIKLFAAPCKFAEPPATSDVSATTSPVCPISPLQPSESGDLRTIAPDVRTELTRIAASTLEFLSKVSRVGSVGDALGLLSEKAALLDSLETWLIDLALLQARTDSPGPEPISVSFLRCFHLILKIVLSGALDYLPDIYAKLLPENDQLYGIAVTLSERLKTYTMSHGTSGV